MAVFTLQRVLFWRKVAKWPTYYTTTSSTLLEREREREFPRDVLSVFSCLAIYFGRRIKNRRVKKATGRTNGSCLSLSTPICCAPPFFYFTFLSLSLSMSFGRERGLWVKMFPSLFSSSSGITEARNSQLWIVLLKKKKFKNVVLGIFFFCVPPLDGASSIEEEEIRSMKMSPMRKWTETSVLSLLHYLVYVCVYSVYIRSWLLPKKLIYSHTHKTGQIGVGSFPTEKKPMRVSLNEWKSRIVCLPFGGE